MIVYDVPGRTGCSTEVLKAPAVLGRAANVLPLALPEERHAPLHNESLVRAVVLP